MHFNGYTFKIVYQSTTQGQLGTLIGTNTDVADTSLVITGLSPGTTYYFTVSVVEVGGSYVDSTQRSETTTTPLWMQPWFIGSIVAIVVVAALVTVLLKRRK